MLLEELVFAFDAAASDLVYFDVLDGPGVTHGWSVLDRWSDSPRTSLVGEPADTPESLVPVPARRILGADGVHVRPNPVTVDELAAEVGSLRAVSPPLHAVAVTGGEPLAQVDFLVTWLRRSPPGLPVLLETAGISLRDAYRPTQDATLDAGLATPSDRTHNTD